jgi:hypothetical protein
MTSTAGRALIEAKLLPKPVDCLAEVGLVRPLRNAFYCLYATT